MFFFDLEDFSTNRISKVNGLAESEVSSIAFNSEQNALVVGYVNGNIDLIFNESQIVNLRDLKNSNIPADKRINAIAFKDGFAYLGCGFGIVVVDIEKNEIKETYLIGENSSYVNVQDLVLIDGFWHAATDNGIYRADASSPFLVLFSTWEKMDSLPDNTGNYTNIELNDYRIYLFMEPDSVFPEIYFRERLEGSDWEAWTEYTESAYTDVYVDNESIVVQDFLQVHIYDINHNLDDSLELLRLQRRLPHHHCLKYYSGHYNFLQ